MAARSEAWVGATPAYRATVRVAEPRWNLAFVGILAYLVIEYTRLPAMIPTLLPLQLGKIAIIVSVLGWVFSPRSLTATSGSRRAIDLAMATLLVASLFSTFFAPHQELAWLGYADILRWGVIYFLVSRIVNSPWRLRIFLFVLLLLNFKLAQFGVRTYLAEVAAYGETVIAIRGAGAGSTGYFANGNDFGLAMDVVWGLSGALLFAQLRTKWRLLLFGAFCVFMVAILRSGSRGALVGAVGVVLATMVRSPRKRLTFPLMALVLLAGLASAYSTASQERMASAFNWEQDVTASHRIMMWKAGVNMLADHPLIGVGPRNFPLVRLSDYPIEDSPWQHLPAVAHSLYIELVSELGLLGTLPVLLLLLLFARLNARTRKHLLALGSEQRKSLEYCLAIGLDLAMVGYLVAGAFASVLWYPHLWLLLALSVALHSIAVQKQAQEDGSPARPPVVPRLWLQTNPR